MGLAHLWWEHVLGHLEATMLGQLGGRMKMMPGEPGPAAYTCLSKNCSISVYTYIYIYCTCITEMKWLTMGQVSPVFK